MANADGPQSSHIKVAATADGCLIRIDGKGTVRESRVVKDVAMRTLRDEPSAVVVLDLSTCAYVDSTFLGCMMDLHRTAGGDGKRFAIAAPVETRKKLLGIARLDRLLRGIDTAPAPAGDFVSVPASDAPPREILRHVMECHQQLAQVDCPMKNIFARIATQMQRELENAR